MTTTPTPTAHATDADLDERLSRVDAIGTNGWHRAVADVSAILAAQHRELRDRVRALEAAMPKRGTWRDRQFGTWRCECVPFAADRDDEQAAGDAVCVHCGTWRPLSAPVAATAAKVGTWDEHGTWRCPSDCGWRHSASVPGCYCGTLRPPAPAAAPTQPDVTALAERMREAAEATDAHVPKAWRVKYGSDGRPNVVCGVSGTVLVATGESGPISDFIAAACPANVLAILTAYDALKAEGDWLRSALREAIKRADIATAELATVRAGYENDLRATERDRDELRARVAELEREIVTDAEAMRAGVHALAERDAALAECAKLRGEVDLWRERAEARAVAVGT